MAMISLLILFIFSIFIPVNSVEVPGTKPIIDFCAGHSHACAVFDSFQMKCWGSGESFGSSSSYGARPTTVGDNIQYFNPGSNLTITKVTCTYLGTCVLLNTGSIKCAGKNNYGQVGLGLPSTISSVRAPTYVGDKLPVVNLGNGVQVISIAAGAEYNCISTLEGLVKCFGRNTFGQLGYGDKINRGTSPSDMGDNLTYIDLGTGVEVASVHSGCGATHSCVIVSKPVGSEQRVKCWGNNNSYQLGYGDRNHRGDALYEMGDNLTLIDFGVELKVKQISLGQASTCALLINNVLKCMGRTAEGQIATGSNQDISSIGNSLPSVVVDIGKAVKYVSAEGQGHTCIVYDDQLTVKCFGWNNFGQLGLGDTVNRGNTPETMIPNITAIDLGTGSLKIKSIHSGWYSSCVIFVDNSIKCFGYNSIGQAAIGKNDPPLNYIGDQPYEMGSNLSFAILFSPTTSPTMSPTNPTSLPTQSPSTSPTLVPTITPTSSPSKSPSNAPTSSPSNLPTKAPTLSPTWEPTLSPTRAPSVKPTKNPSNTPSILPTNLPTSTPTKLCDYPSAKLCIYDQKCMWLMTGDGTKQCVMYDCAVLNKSKCGKERSRCKWSKKQKICSLKLQS